MEEYKEFVLPAFTDPWLKAKYRLYCPAISLPNDFDGGSVDVPSRLEVLALSGRYQPHPVVFVNRVGDEQRLVVIKADGRYIDYQVGPGSSQGRELWDAAERQHLTVGSRSQIREFVNEEE